MSGEGVEANETMGVQLSSDRRTTVVRPGDGRVLTLRSERAEGFTAEQVAAMRNRSAYPAVTKGQKNRSWRRRLLGRSFYLHVNTGPPSWWLPHIEVTRHSVMVGWFRGLVAVSTDR